MPFVAIGWSVAWHLAIVNTYPNRFNRSHIMNLAKNMEAIFLVAIGLISATGFATASAPALAPAAIAAPDKARMHVVTISAKRMTAAEKAASAQ